MILKTQKIGLAAMRALLSFLHNLFGGRGLAAEDHLMGAVDLSDAHYCFGLLDSTREQ